MSIKRPEELGISPAAFYDTKEAKKYNESSRITHIQEELTNRAIELLALPVGKAGYILDIGCGSGLSGKTLEKAGHYWVGCDISADMLSHAAARIQGEAEGAAADSDDSAEEEDSEGEGEQVAQNYGNAKMGNTEEASEDEDEDEYEYDSQEENPNKKPRYPALVASRPVLDGGDVVQADMGQGLPYRPGSFDGVISISAIQWLCYSTSSDQDPKLRLNRFFSSLYSVLKRDAKAVLQFYPENAEQAVLIAQAASRVGFAGGVLVDYPNSSKAKKYYLCLSFERTYQVPAALGTGETDNKLAGNINVVGRVADPRNKRHVKHGSRAPKKSAEWIIKKKDRHKKQGKEVKSDSKFTGRKRSRGF